MNFEDLLPKRISIRKQEYADLHFIVVGAGGTGGYLMRDLARIVSLENEKTERLSSSERTNHGITLIDGDIVEEKNLSRQNFVRQDIGKNKADVIAGRYGRAFGLPVNVIPEFLSSPNDLYDYVTQLHDPYRHRSDRRFLVPVFIDCVDNNATRLYIAAAVQMLAEESRLTSYTISSGNSERTGQVLFSQTVGNGKETYTMDLKSVIHEFGSHESPYFMVTTPSFFDLFPSIEIDKDPTQLSCAEQSVSAPQNIVTNMNAANIVFAYALRLLNGEQISTVAIFYDTKTGRQTEYELSVKDLPRLFAFTSDNPSAKYYMPSDSLHREEFRKVARSGMHDSIMKMYEDFLQARENELAEAEAKALEIFNEQGVTSDTETGQTLESRQA